MLQTLLLAVACVAGPAPQDASPTKPVALFDGKSLDGWDGNPKFWSVEDGAITGQTTKENPTKGNTFLIWRCLLYTSPSPRDLSTSRMPSSA